MKLEEQVDILVKEIEKVYYFEGHNSYIRICEDIAVLKKNAESLYVLIEILNQLDNVQYMMHCYLPKHGYYDHYGSRSKMENERNLSNLARETKRLITTLQKLKTQLKVMRTT